jgi:hypothetical protein
MYQRKEWNEEDLTSWQHHLNLNNSGNLRSALKGCFTESELTYITELVKLNAYLKQITTVSEHAAIHVVFNEIGVIAVNPCHFLIVDVTDKPGSLPFVMHLKNKIVQYADLSGYTSSPQFNLHEIFPGCYSLTALMNEVNPAWKNKSAFYHTIHENFVKGDPLKEVIK